MNVQTLKPRARHFAKIGRWMIYHPKHSHALGAVVIAETLKSGLDLWYKCRLKDQTR